jgi:type IV pilus assembly protein PilW
MNYRNKRSLRQASGFTLVEIMIGLVIGMLATLVIMQVMSVFEGQKRATTGTADAQTNGQISLYNIGRELQVAGYPLLPTTSVPIGSANVPDSPLECTTLTFGATGITNISPVTIANGTSDTISIRYGTSASGGVPARITGAAVGSAVPVETNFGCQVGSISFITNGPICAISSVTALSSVGITPKTVSLQNTTNVTAGADLSCLGAWNTITYAVSAGNLQRSVNTGGSTVTGDSVAGIVNMQAQYGISTSAASNQIAQWVDATGTWTPASVGLAPAIRNRIKAVRIAVVARNPQMEAAAVTTSCSSYTTAAPTGLCAWAGTTTSPAPAIDLSADANWARYRYRVYETIIPLRNMIWSRETL